MGLLRPNAALPSASVLKGRPAAVPAANEVRGRMAADSTSVRRSSVSQEDLHQIDNHTGTQLAADPVDATGGRSVSLR